MARYLERCERSETIESLKQNTANLRAVDLDAMHNWEEDKCQEAKHQETDIRELVSRQRNLHLVMDDTFADYSRALDDEQREQHRIWYPAYCLYAADNNLHITEENYLDVCNKHYQNWQSESGRVVLCNCTSAVRDNNHTYTFGDQTCSAGTNIFAIIHNTGYGLIAEEEPEYSLAYI